MTISTSRIFAGLGLAGALALAPMAASATSCGTDKKITIAEMTWLSAATIAHATKRILETGYGCNAVLVPGDTVPTASSLLTKGQPMIAPELWISSAEAIWKKILKKGHVYKAGDVFTNGGNEGWWIPDYVAKANPKLKSVDDLKDYVDLFKEPASGGKGRLYACPPGWACEIINTNLFKALKLEDANFEIFSPGSGANLKASIARKIARKKPLLTYYWGPTPVIGKYNLVRLETPKYDAKRFACLSDKDCENPQASGWKKGEVVVAAVKSLQKDAPAVAEYLSKMQIPNKIINSMLAWGDDNSASPDEIAVHFMKAHADVWTKWVPADVAKKVQASL